jgi:hypothetical protein
MTMKQRWTHIVSEPENISHFATLLAELILGAQETCKMPDNWAEAFPNCEIKLGVRKCICYKELINKL